MMDLVASNAALKPAAVLMSGLGSLRPTASPMIMRATLFAELPSALPSFANASIPSGVETTTSAATPWRIISTHADGGPNSIAMP